MPSTLRGLLTWASTQYRSETPNLDHEHGEVFDEGGAKAMKPAAATYLGLQAKRYLEERVSRAVGRPAFGIGPVSRTGEPAGPAPLRDDRTPDNWKGRAGRRDRDGRYVTPLRFAIELCPDPDERSFLRALVPELYYPSEIAEIHGIPKWAAGMVMFATLSRLRERYDNLMRQQEKGTAANVGWVSMSESSRNAIVDGEKVA